MNILSLFNPALQFAQKHLPEVAIWTGTALEGAAVIFGIRDTPKAMEVLEAKKPETIVQKAEIAVTSYWKTILCFAAGTYLIFRGNKLHLERTAAALAIAATQKDKLTAMAEETRKLVGPKKAQEIQENVETRNLDMKKVEAQYPPVRIGGDTLFVCEWNNFAFLSSTEHIKDINNELLRETMACKAIDKADVEAIIGIPGRKSDYGVGFNIDHPPTLKISKWTEGPNGEPMGVLMLEPEPQEGWVLNSGYLF